MLRLSRGPNTMFEIAQGKSRLSPDDPKFGPAVAGAIQAGPTGPDLGGAAGMMPRHPKKHGLANTPANPFTSVNLCDEVPGVFPHIPDFRLAQDARRGPQPRGV